MVNNTVGSPSHGDSTTTPSVPFGTKSRITPPISATATTMSPLLNFAIRRTYNPSFGAATSSDDGRTTSQLGGTLSRDRRGAVLPEPHGARMLKVGEYAAAGGDAIAS